MYPQAGGAQPPACLLLLLALGSSSDPKGSVRLARTLNL